MRNVLLRNNQKVFIRHRTFWDCNVKLTWTFLAGYYKLCVNLWITKAKPAILVYAYPNLVHFVIYFQHSTLEWLAVLLNARISANFTFKCSKSVRLSASLLFKDLKIFQFTKALQVLLKHLL